MSILSKLNSAYSSARTTTFEHDGMEITIREPMVIDDFFDGQYHNTLKEALLKEVRETNPTAEKIDNHWWNAIVPFVTAMQQVIEVKPANNKSFPRVINMGNEQELVEAFGDFLTMDKNLYAKWNEAVLKLQTIEPVPPVTPGADKSKTNT